MNKNRYFGETNTVKTDKKYYELIPLRVVTTTNYS